jgi:hypothetical protein
MLKTIAPYSNSNGTPPLDWFDENGIPLFYEAWRAKPGSQASEPSKRSSLLEHRSRVACWPSTGGVWIKHALRPDLDFLGIPYNEDVDRLWPYNSMLEDEFCYKMRLVGSSFYTLAPV